MRLGSIEFINSLPVDLGILSRAVSLEAKVFQGSPSFLNEKIMNSELDVSPVSALHYAMHWKDLFLLPDLSISSKTSVQSVLLFSRYELKDLKDKEILLTSKGRTTPALLEIICRFRYGFSPRFKALEGDFSRFFNNKEENAALLLIGDDALVAKKRFESPGVGVIDLAEEWKLWTQCPIVFAVWVARSWQSKHLP